MIHQSLLGVAILVSIWGLANWLDEGAWLVFSANVISWAEGLRWLAENLAKLARGIAFGIVWRSPDLPSWAVRRLGWIVIQFCRCRVARRDSLLLALRSSHEKPSSGL